MIRILRLLALGVLLLEVEAVAQDLPVHSCNDRGICCERWKIPLLWNDGKTENVGTGTWGAIVDPDLAAAQAKLAAAQERERESCTRTGKSYPCWEAGYGNPQPPRCVEPPPESDPCSADIQARVTGLLEKTRARTKDLIVGNPDAPFADDIVEKKLTAKAVEKVGLKPPPGYRAGQVTQGYANSLGDAAKKLGDLKKALELECAPVPNPIVDLYGNVFNGFEDRHSRRRKLTKRIEDVCGPAEELINVTEPRERKIAPASPPPTSTARTSATQVAQTEDDDEEPTPPPSTPAPAPTRSSLRTPLADWAVSGRCEKGTFVEFTPFGESTLIDSIVRADTDQLGRWSKDLYLAGSVSNFPEAQQAHLKSFASSLLFYKSALKSSYALFSDGDPSISYYVEIGRRWGGDIPVDEGDANYRKIVDALRSQGGDVEEGILTSHNFRSYRSAMIAKALAASAYEEMMALRGDEFTVRERKCVIEYGLSSLKVGFPSYVERYLYTDEKKARDDAKRTLEQQESRIK